MQGYWNPWLYPSDSAGASAWDRGDFDPTAYEKGERKKSDLNFEYAIIRAASLSGLARRHVSQESGMLNRESTRLTAGKLVTENDLQIEEPLPF